MKLFNLERALAGDPVRCRDESIKVLRLIHIPGLNRKDCILVVYLRQNNSIEQCAFWYTEGYYSADGPNHLDLFMATKKVTKWVNVYQSPKGFYPGTYFGDSFEEVKSQADKAYYIGTFPIEIEI